MDEERRELDSQGETAQIAVPTVSAGEMESILVMITSIFLVLAVLLLGSQLYLFYGIGKEESRSERNIEK